jgi:type IV secretory pathway TraG/TraD family ATPase VirD4
MSENKIEIPATSDLPGFVYDPAFLLMICTGLAYVVFLILRNRNTRKGVLAKARFAGATERRAARKLACELMEARKHNEVAFYISTPRNAEIIHENDGKTTLVLPEDPTTLYIPNAQEMIFVVGAPGSGKSFSVTDPMMRCATDQGHTIVAFDYKGYEESATDLAPTSKLAGYAKERGYQVYVLAPGSQESDSCNILDFLTDSRDGQRAYQLGNVLQQNLKLSGEGSSSGGFFSLAGNQLIQAILMLAKGSDEYADIALCHKILALPELSKRIAIAKLPQYQKTAFDNFLASAGSPETAASIASTASIMFSRFMSPEILGVFGNKTSIPLDLKGRTLLIFRMDPQKEAAIAPLMASVIHLIAYRNIFTKRTNPICFFLDEVSTIYLPSLPNLLNLGRSAGAVFCLAVQSIGLLEKTYGKQDVEAILGACKTQFIAQLNENRTAQYYCEQLGREEVFYQQRSRSSGKGGGSTSRADHQQTRPLVEIQELMQMLQGEVILLNPGYRTQKSTRIPYRTRIKIPKRDIQSVKNAGKVWAQIKQQKIKNNASIPPTDDELAQREKLAEQMLPLPIDSLEEQVAAKF